MSEIKIRGYLKTAEACIEGYMDSQTVQECILQTLEGIANSLLVLATLCADLEFDPDSPVGRNEVKQAMSAEGEK